MKRLLLLLLAGCSAAGQVGEIERGAPLVTLATIPVERVKTLSADEEQVEKANDKPQREGHHEHHHHH